METFTDQDLLAELLAEDPPIIERHGGVTVVEYAEGKGISTSRASGRLLQKVRAGKLYREWSRVGGQCCFVYYKTGS